MDLEEVYMTTKLAGDATFFLPFNMGNGEGVTAGAGNPVFEDKYSVSYMWEDILTKDTILDLISKFIFVEIKEKVDDKTGKIKRSENLIFPRYHQLDVIRKVLADVRENRTAQNYLIQHSAGSGKTNSIAWLAHRLTSLHDAENKIRDILMKSDKLKTSAKNNTQQDFEFSYFDDIDDALIEGLSQNQEFFSMLLSNDEMKHQVMGIFSDEIYKSLRESV